MDKERKKKKKRPLEAKMTPKGDGIKVAIPVSEAMAGKVDDAIKQMPPTKPPIRLYAMDPHRKGGIYHLCDKAGASFCGKTPKEIDIITLASAAEPKVCKKCWAVIDEEWLEKEVKAREAVARAGKRFDRTQEVIKYLAMIA